MIFVCKTEIINCTTKVQFLFQNFPVLFYFFCISLEKFFNSIFQTAAPYPERAQANGISGLNSFISLSPPISSNASYLPGTIFIVSNA